MTTAAFQPLNFVEYPAHEMRERAESFRKHMQMRRTVRHFSDRPVPRGIIEECLLTVGTATNLAREAGMWLGWLGV